MVSDLAGYQRTPIHSRTSDARSKSFYSEEFHSPSQRSRYCESFPLSTLIKQPSKHPTLLRDSSVERIWFKKDDTFWVPKLYTYFLLRTYAPSERKVHTLRPKSTDSPLNSMLTVYAVSNFTLTDLSQIIYCACRGSIE